MKNNAAVLDALPQQTWSNVSIQYTPVGISELKSAEYTVLINSADYLWPDGSPRYVAVKGGQVIAVQTSHLGFCNMCVDSLWEGNLMGLYPGFIRNSCGNTVYDIPILVTPVEETA